MKRFWFYEKKRGQRRTGSRKLASFGEGILFLVLFLAGCVGMAAMIWGVLVPEWRANRQFRETQCTVLGSRVKEAPDSEGILRFLPEIHIRYEVEGETYDLYRYDAAMIPSFGREKAERVCAQFESGKTYECWYDPLDPTRSVVVRGYSGWLYLFLLVPGSLLVIGATGLTYTWLHWGTSQERRAMLMAKSRQSAPLDKEDPELVCLPSIPGDTDFRNSPGTRLAYRLPTTSAPVWTLFSTIAITVAWCIMALVFLILSIKHHLQGEHDWFLTFFALLFSGIGGLLIWYCAKQVIATAAIGLTQVEISHHPLVPAHEYSLLVTQTGRLDITRFEVSLICEEKATFHQGTNTRTETRRVFEQQITRSGPSEVRPDAPLERACQLQIPAAAMHSFKAEHNEVNWRILVRGKFKRWPPFERAFPIIVHPTPPVPATSVT